MNCTISWRDQRVGISGKKSAAAFAQLAMKHSWPRLMPNTGKQVLALLKLERRRCPVTPPPSDPLAPLPAEFLLAMRNLSSTVL
jgi:hypothetical protein